MLEFKCPNDKKVIMGIRAKNKTQLFKLPLQLAPKTISFQNNPRTYKIGQLMQKKFSISLEMSSWVNTKSNLHKFSTLMAHNMIQIMPDAEKNLTPIVSSIKKLSVFNLGAKEKWLNWKLSPAFKQQKYKTNLFRWLERIFRQEEIS